MVRRPSFPARHQPSTVRRLSCTARRLSCTARRLSSAARRPLSTAPHRPASGFVGPSRRRFLIWASTLALLPDLLVRAARAFAGHASPDGFGLSPGSSPRPMVLRRRPRRPSVEFAPFPHFSATGIYGIGTYQAGSPDLFVRTLAGGARLIDTSPDYRHGETEEEVGRALEAIDAPVFVMTQIPVSAWERENREIALHRALRQSLGRLGRRRVEALLVRNAEPWQPRDPAFRAFARDAKRRGLVERFGASGHGPDLEDVLTAALDDELMEIVLFGAHLARFRTVPRLLVAARRRGKLLVAMKSREAAYFNRDPGWEEEAERIRHAPWNGRWRADFTRRALQGTVTEMGAHNALLSLRRSEDVDLVLDR